MAYLLWSKPIINILFFWFMEAKHLLKMEMVISYWLYHQLSWQTSAITKDDPKPTAERVRALVSREDSADLFRQNLRDSRYLLDAFFYFGENRCDEVLVWGPSPGAILGVWKKSQKDGNGISRNVCFSIPFLGVATIWVCLKIGYIPNEIAIQKRDNDQQNHWV